MEKVKQYLFKNTSTKQTFIKNTFWLFVGEFGVKFLKLFIFIYAARKLGVSEWGVFSYAIALISFFNIISDIGLNSVLLRETAKNNPEQPQYISTSFFLKFGLSIISSLLLLSLLLFLKDNNVIKILIPITALLLFLDTMREFGFSLNRAFEKMEIEAMTKISTTIILVTLGFVFIRYEARASSLLYAYVISSALGIVIMYSSLKKNFKNLILNFNKNLLIPIWREAWPVGIAGALGTVLASMDIIILGWFQTPDQIGLYSTAQKPVQMMYLFPILISTAILPAFSRFAYTDKERMRDITNKMIKWSFLFTIPMVILCLTISGPIFILLFGQQYALSIPIFKIMSFTIITSAPSVIISKAIFAEGKQKQLIQFIIISLFVNTTLCLLTIPRFGIYGAAISVTIAQVVGNLFLMRKYKKILK